MIRLDIENKIIEFLEIQGCALSSQILNSFEVSDGRYISGCLNQLVNNQKVNKMLYRGFDFYYLPGDESEIKRKVRIVKRYILQVVKALGPVMGKPLVQKIRDNYDYLISPQIVYYLAKELIQDKKLDSKKKTMSHIYYIYGDQNQEIEAIRLSKGSSRDKRRDKTLNQENDKFYSKAYSFLLDNESKENLTKIKLEFDNYNWDFDQKGRSFNDCIQIYYYLSTKKKIHLILKGNTEIGDLNSWIKLNEYFSSKFYKISSDSRTFFTKNILNQSEFCDIDSRMNILQSPNVNLRINFFLTKTVKNLNLSPELETFISEILKKVQHKLIGKGIKGIVGGAVYFALKLRGYRISQDKICTSLNISEVTLRSRTKDIKHILEDVYTYPKPIKKPEKGPNSVSLEDKSSKTPSVSISETQEIRDSNKLYDLFTDDEIMIFREVSTAFACFLIDKFHNMNEKLFRYGCTSKKYYDEFSLNFNLPLNKNAERSARYFNFLKGNYFSADSIYTIRQSRGYGCVKNLDKRELCKFDSCDQLKKKNRCNRKRKNIWASDYDNMPGTIKGWRFVENYHQRVCEEILRYKKLQIIPFLKIFYKNEYDNQKVISLTSRFLKDFNFNYENVTLIFKLDKSFVTPERDVSRETYKDKLIRLFSKEDNDLYQTKCGKKYFQITPFLKHYLNCPECSNELIDQNDENFYYCRCGKRYRYTYQLTSHFEKCQPFIEYLRAISKTLKY